MIKAVIFDLDGTVVDSTSADFSALQRAFQDAGIDFSYKDYAELVGEKGEEIVRTKAPGLSDHEVHNLLARKAEYFKDLVRKNGLEPVQGIEKVLKQIKEVPLWTALATGSEKDKLDFIFERVKLDQYFDVILTADETKAGKPEPEVFLNAGKQVFSNPEECLVFEDSIRGVKAAKNAGMRCVAIAGTSDKESLKQADLVIDNFDDLDFKELISQFYKETV